jgi:hypothetical protein
MPFEQLASGFGQDDGVVTVAGHPTSSPSTPLQKPSKTGADK